MPEYDRYHRFKVTEFEYTDAGITKFAGEGEDFQKPVWHSVVKAVKDMAKTLSVYEKLLKNISKLYDSEKIRTEELLERLVGVVASAVLTKELTDSSQLDDYVARFLKDLNEEKQEYSARVGLHGIIMQPKVIELDENTLLKKTTASDLEREVMAGVGYVPPVVVPTAIMHITVLAHGVFELQEEIQKAIAILKLFKVGAVRHVQYETSSKSITDILVGGTYTNPRAHGAGRYLITEQEAPSIRNFWSRFKDFALPDSFYKLYQPSMKEDHLSIAYQRYEDTFDLVSGEKQFASAIMGLEAFYLLPSERQELSYRLALRAAKLLSLTGYSPNEVQADLSDAYKVRNIYVHGGLLSLKQARKLARRRGPLDQFQRRTQDYLRASIVIFIKSRPCKKSLIKLIDDTFVNVTKNSELRKTISPALG